MDILIRRNGKSAIQRGSFPFKNSFSIYGALTALIFSAPLGFLSYKVPSCLPLFLLVIAWTGVVSGLPLLERDINALLLPEFSKQRRFTLGAGMLVVILVCALQGAVAGRDLLYVVAMAANIISFGIILAVAPVGGLLVAFFLLPFLSIHFVLALLLNESGIPDIASICLTVAAVPSICAARWLWVRRESFTDLSRPAWKLSSTAAFYRLRQRGQYDIQVWKNSGSRFNQPFMLTSRMYGPSEPHMAIRNVIGYPFLSPFANRLLMVIAFCIPVAGWVFLSHRYDYVGIDRHLKSMNIGMSFVVTLVAPLRRLIGSRKNASELAELSLLPGLGSSHDLRRNYLRSIIGCMSADVLIASMLSAIAIAIIGLVYHRSNWIVPSLSSYFGQVACWLMLSAGLIFFILASIERALLPKIFFGAIFAVVYFNPSWDLRYAATGVVAMIGCLFYQRWSRQPHPFLLP